MARDIPMAKTPAGESCRRYVNAYGESVKSIIKLTDGNVCDTLDEWKGHQEGSDADVNKRK